VNTSGKLITGYGWSVIHTYADGSTDALPDGHPSGRTEAEFLGGWIDSEMRKGTPTEGLFQDSGTIGSGREKSNTILSRSSKTWWT
jgi:hypothetical protein